MISLRNIFSLNFFLIWLLCLQYACTSSNNELNPEMNEVITDDESNNKNFVFSQKNNGTTSSELNKNEIHSLLMDIKSKKRTSKKDKLELLNEIIAAEMLVNSNFKNINKYFMNLSNITLEGSPDAKVSEVSRLNLAISAFRHKKKHMANFLLDELSTSKNKQVLSGLNNTLGLIAYDDSRIPEAVEYWEQALKYDSHYKASLLNLGFINLKFGHFEKAIAFLTKVKNDWYAESGLLVAYRLTGSSDETSKLCEKLLPKHSQHKLILFNCGVHEWQSNSSTAKAKKLIQQALKVQGGPAAWNRHINEVLKSIR